LLANGYGEHHLRINSLTFPIPHKISITNIPPLEYISKRIDRIQLNLKDGKSKIFLANLKIKYPNPTKIDLKDDDGRSRGILYNFKSDGKVKYSYIQSGPGTASPEAESPCCSLEPLP
jgi:hypothetical protein